MRVVSCDVCGAKANRNFIVTEECTVTLNVGNTLTCPFGDICQNCAFEFAQDFDEMTNRWRRRIERAIDEKHVKEFGNQE